MERKLVQHGESTLMVSLPKKWLVRQHLGKGDSVNIVDMPDKLVVAPVQQKKKSLDADIQIKRADYEEVRAVLGHLYRKGYEKVTLKYDDPRCIYFIQLITRAIQGFEIIDQKDKSCVIKNVTKEISVDVEDMLNKVINLIKTEFILVREYLSKGLKGKDAEIKMVRDDCWKFRNMVYVQLKENLLFSAFKNYFNVHVFEYNASFLYWTYRSFDRSSLNRVSPQFLVLYDEITDYFVKSVSKMKKKDDDYIDYIMIKREKLLKECEAYTLGNAKDRFLAIYLGMLVQNIHNPKSLIV